MDVEEISEILKEEVTKNHPEIAIIAIYGSAARGQQSEYSDLDMFAIVDNEDKKFDINFVFNNQTVEFWCVSWGWVEKIVSAKNDASPIIYPIRTHIFINNKVIYSRSEKDESRFKNLLTLSNIERQKQIEIISNHFNYLFGLIERLEFAKERDDVLSARWVIWDFINCTVCILGFINNRTYSKNWGSNLYETFEFELLPEFYKEDIFILVSSNNFDELIDSGKRVIRQLRKILYSERKEIQLNPKEQFECFITDDIYYGFKGYLNKILSACAKEDILAASYAASELQVLIAASVERIELGRFVDDVEFNQYTEVKNSYEVLNFPDLSESITKKDFQELRKKVKSLDKLLTSYLEKKDVKIRHFKNISQIREYASTK